jgi:hypothetical protein
MLITKTISNLKVVIGILKSICKDKGDILFQSIQKIESTTFIVAIINVFLSLQQAKFKAWYKRHICNIIKCVDLLF